VRARARACSDAIKSAYVVKAHVPPGSADANITFLTKRNVVLKGSILPIVSALCFQFLVASIRVISFCEYLHATGVHANSLDSSSDLIKSSPLFLPSFLFAIYF